MGCAEEEAHPTRYELTSAAMWADLENKIAGISADPAAEWMNIEALFV
ncbi:MAG: hypothetical protein HC889_06465 [Synechococcaceae cyanobacterium SM1_2_3]|nr:hypothetical protein [Synechococcaceae cyanobacterium SM1_2_3]